MWLLVHWQVAGLKGQHIMVPANSYYHGSLHQLHLRIHQGGVPFNKINPDQWPFADVESSHTLLKFNSSPLKIGHPKRKPDRLPSIHFSVAMSVLRMVTNQQLATHQLTRYNKYQQITPISSLGVSGSSCPQRSAKNFRPEKKNSIASPRSFSLHFLRCLQILRIWPDVLMILTRRPLRRVEIPYLRMFKAPKNTSQLGIS